PMRTTSIIVTLAAWFWISAADMARAAAPSAVVEAWTAVDRWLDRSPSGPGWRKFLGSDDLERQITASVTPQPATVAAVLKQLRSGAPGLEHARFQALEN